MDKFIIWLTPIAAIVGAVYLASLSNGNWFWFLLAGLILALIAAAVVSPPRSKR